MKKNIIREFPALVYLPLILTCFVRVVIAEETEQLEQMTVTPDQEPTSLQTAPPLGYHLDNKTLVNIPGGGSDPLRAMQALPGVIVNDDSSADPAIRGSRPEDNSYFVDFLPSGYLFHAGGTVSVFNAQLIESFDYFPAAYGASVVSYIV